MNKHIKDCFKKYEKVRQSGKYNMITEATQAAKEAGLTMIEYATVVFNYSEIKKQIKQEK